jgi:hypothetical protein
MTPDDIERRLNAMEDPGRTKLKKMHGKRMTFRAVVGGFSMKANRFGQAETILLKDVSRIDTGQVVTDHVWFTKGVSWAGLHEGDTVEFDARVGDYTKGYVNWREGIDERRLDYKLNNPTKVRKVEDKSHNPPTGR